MSVLIRIHIVGKQPPAVFVLMAIDAEVFPIRAIRRIIAMISIPVMDREEMPVLLFKLPPAFCTDKSVYPE